MEKKRTTAGSPPCWSAAVSSLLTPRLELGGLVGGGTLLVRSGGGLDGVSRQSLLGRPATVLVGVLAVPLFLSPSRPSCGSWSFFQFL